MLQEQILQCQRNGELQIERSVTENEKLKQQLEEAISSAKTVQEKYDICRGKLSEYENSYFDIHMYYKKCKELFQANPLLQRDLQNVINLQNEEAFIGAGCQQENLDALWDCLSYKLTVYTEAELKTLNDLFFYFLSIFNDVQELYAPIKTAIGDAFDEDIHARGEGSKISGQIHEVYLEGYRNVKTGKVVKKSIVRI